MLAAVVAAVLAAVVAAVLAAVVAAVLAAVWWQLLGNLFHCEYSSLSGKMQLQFL